MQFLYPNVLWALFAVLIPLIIHLFNFRKRIKVYFSNVSLLKEITTEASSFKAIKDIATLLTRMLAIACLVFAFAGPTNTNQELENNNNVAIYLDNSLSMKNTAQNSTFLSLALNKIDELLNLGNKTSKYVFIENDFSSKDLKTFLGFQLKDRLTTVDYSKESRTANAITSRLPSNVNQIFWFSDFQKSTLGKPINDSTTKFHLVPIQNPNSLNVSIDSVWLKNAFIQTNEANSVLAKVKNSGKATSVFLKLEIENMPISTTEIKLGENEEKVTSLNFSLKENKNYKAKISFNDNSLDFDNDFYFILNAQDQIRIVHIYNQLDSENYIKNLFSDNQRIDLNSYSVNSINYESIKNADLVIIENLKTIPQSLSTSLSNFKGSLAVIPNNDINTESYSRFLSHYKFYSIEKTNKTDLEITSPIKHTFFNGVFDKKWDDTPLILPKNNQEIKWKGGRNILTFGSGDPFLSVNNKETYLFSSSFNKTSGSFSQHAFFVPTLLKIAINSIKGSALSYTFDQQIILKDPNVQSKLALELSHNDHSFYPEQSVLKSIVKLEIPKSSDLEQELSPGFYTLSQGSKTLKTIAINNSKAESDISYYNQKELKNFFPNATVYESSFDSKLITSFSNSQKQVSYWKYFIIAALLFLLIETLIVRFSKN